MATTRESSTRRLTVLLTLATAVLLPLLASSVQAAEELPSGVKFPNSEAQQKVKAYLKEWLAEV